MTPGRTVLVTGGAGFIGSHTVLALEKAGHRTVVYDNFSTGHRDACFGTHLVEGYISNRKKLANAHVAAIEALMAGKVSGFRALNLGSGHGHSLRQIIQTVENVSGRRIPFVDAPRRPGDPAELVDDPSAAQCLLGWKASRSGVETIVNDAWRFFHG
jgi:UDP-glucose 4-epimerase